MIYRILADSVMVVHFIFIVYAVFGGLLALKWKWTVFLHIPVALWGVLVEMFGWICPLTPLENEFRQAAGLAGYTGGFIDHYLLPVVYPPNLTRQIQLMLGAALLLFNIAVYSLVIFRSKNS